MRKADNEYRTHLLNTLEINGNKKHLHRIKLRKRGEQKEKKNNRKTNPKTARKKTNNLSQMIIK